MKTFQVLVARPVSPRRLKSAALAKAFLVREASTVPTLPKFSTFATLGPRRLSVAPAPPTSLRTLRPSDTATRCRRLESRGRNARYSR